MQTFMVEKLLFFFPGGHLPGDMLCKFSKCPRQATCKSLIKSTTCLHGLSQGPSLSQRCGGFKGLHSDSWKPSGPEDIAGKGTPKRASLTLPSGVPPALPPQMSGEQSREGGPQVGPGGFLQLLTCGGSEVNHVTQTCLPQRCCLHKRKLVTVESYYYFKKSLKPRINTSKPNHHQTNPPITGRCLLMDRIPP